MYRKCRSLEEAVKIFSNIKEAETDVNGINKQRAWKKKGSAWAIGANAAQRVTAR